MQNARGHSHAAILSDLWWQGVRAVDGGAAVTAALVDAQLPQPDQIIAIGKAASPMATAALAHFGDAIATLVITKYGHSDDLAKHVRLIEAAHPVPDGNALIAGRALHDTVAGLGRNAHLLMLVSGGASALAEVPEDGLTLADLQAENREMLAQGLDIHAMNARRKTLSRIKGGRLFEAFAGARVTSLAISDVEGDALDVIGSGIGNPPLGRGFEVTRRIVASNAIARRACVAAAREHGLIVQCNEENLYHDVTAVAEQIVDRVRNGDDGLYVFGGEPTVQLPPDPGLGGRNQALALLLAREMAGQPGLTALVAGTDGTDGPTDAAGGLVDGATWGDGGAEALRRADSHRFLKARKALFITGPTGTNVMDLVLVLKDQA